MTALALTLGAPLMAAFAAVLWPRGAFLAALGAIAATGGAVLWLAVSPTPLAMQPGGWEAPLGIALKVDPLARAFLALAALVMAGVLLAARADFAPGTGRAAFGFWPLALLLWAAMNAVIVSQDLFNLFVGLELLTLAAVALVALQGGRAPLAAALRYMLWAIMASLLYLLGVVLIYSAHGTLDLAGLAARSPAPADGLALALMTVGLAIKAALFPFHAWLPPAHGGASAPASALLSALVPKASFLILLRLWSGPLADLAAPAALIALGALGAAAIVYGAALALRQRRLKLLAAYSTVTQLGYLFIVFPLMAGGLATGALAGVTFHAVSHGLAKAALFLAAGRLIAGAGQDDLAALRGRAPLQPVASLSLALAALTLMGLPPSGGFIAKLLMVEASLAAGLWPFAVVLILGALFSALYLFLPLEALFARSQSGTPSRPAAPRSPAGTADWAALSLALAAIGMGLFPGPLMALFPGAAPGALPEIGA